MANKAAMFRHGPASYLVPGAVAPGILNAGFGPGLSWEIPTGNLEVA